MLAIRQEARSSCGTSPASSRRRRLTIVFIASSALASLYVLVVIVWGRLHNGAHALQRELCVRQPSAVGAELFLPEQQPFRRVRSQAAAVRPSKLAERLLKRSPLETTDYEQFRCLDQVAAGLVLRLFLWGYGPAWGVWCLAARPPPM